MHHPQNLLPGDRVEVRQREAGLRGSWHPATVVGLKSGRRLVEYDELLTVDGRHKLREYIPVKKGATFSPRQNEAIRNSPRLAPRSLEPKNRGFLRPIPPPCSEPPLESCKRGFLVDVFFQDAWWEAVLLDDIASLRDDSLIHVLFPDEGDKDYVSVVNLRISQEWDEDTGHWSVKGSCNLSELLNNRAVGRKQMGQGYSRVSDVELKDVRATTNDEAESRGDFVRNVQSNPCVQRITESDTDTKKGQVELPISRCLKLESHKPLPVLASQSAAPSSTKDGTGSLELITDDSSLLDWLCKEKGIYRPPITYQENRGKITPSSTVSGRGMDVPNGLSGVKRIWRKEEHPCKDSESRRHTVVTENLEVCSGIDADRCAEEDFVCRGETGACTLSGVGAGTFIPGEPFIKDNVKKKSRQGVAKSHCKQDVEFDTSQLSVSVTSVVNNTSLSEERGSGMIPYLDKADFSDVNSLRVEAGRETDSGSGMIPYLDKADSSDVNSLRVEAGREAHSEARAGSPTLLHSILTQQSVMPDEAGEIKKKSVRPPRRLEAPILSQAVPLKNGKLAKLKAGLQEAKLRLKGEADSVKGATKPKTKMKNVTLGKRPRTGSQEDEKGSDSLNDREMRAGKVSTLEDGLTFRTLIHALKDKVTEIGEGAENDKVLDSLRQLYGLVKVEGTTDLSRKGFKRKNESVGIAVLKNLVREVAKEVLQEAGFRVEFRPRRSKDYQDPVYVSPRGSAYWSLPKAWQAWKQIQAKTALSADRNPACMKSSLTIASLSGDNRKDTGTFKHGGKGLHTHLGANVLGKRECLLKDGEVDGRITHNTLQELEKAGSLSVRGLGISEDDFKRLHLTKSQWANLFLEDLCILKRTTQKGRKKQEKEPGSDKKHKNKCLEGKRGGVLKASEHLVSDKVDELRGRKRKLENQNAREKVNKKFSGDKAEAINRTLALRKGSDKVRQPPLALLKKLLVKHRLAGPSTKKSGGEHSLLVCTKKTKPSVKQEKIAKRLKSDGLSGFEFGPHTKKSRGIPNEKTLAHKSVSKKGNREFLTLVHPEGKKTKVIVSHDKKGNNQETKSGLRLKVRTAAARKGEASLWKSEQTILSWMIDRGALSEREKVLYMDWEKNQVLKEGVVIREGIVCKCCRQKYTIHCFEVHAGSHAGGPGRNIVFASGRSLFDCQLQAWAVEVRIRKTQNYVGVSDEDRNDDTCLLCGDGGDLLCCDHCPSTFHPFCLQMQNIPEGIWCCPRCSCAVCGGSQHNNELKDSSWEEMLSCSQCEHRYHTSCLDGGSIVAGNNSFCGHPCQKIFSDLNKLIGICHPLDRGFSWTLLRCSKEDWVSQSHENVQVTAEQHSKLAVALLVMQECFVPMNDPRTNIDMLTHVVYNHWSEFDRLNYNGFYTAILERNDQVISAASIRVHGTQLAEMPLIGTRQRYRRQGMCRLLVSEIEKMLSSLAVANFVLPAIPELFKTWTDAFGFKPVDAAQRFAFRNLSIMMFPGTELLQKLLPRKLKVDKVPAEIQLSQKQDSQLELLESDVASAVTAPKSEENHFMKVETSNFPSYRGEGCREEGSSLVECVASRFDLPASKSGRASSCTEAPGLVQTWLPEGEGTVTSFEHSENTNLCKPDAACLWSNGTLKGSRRWRIEAAHPAMPLKGEQVCPETSSEEKARKCERIQGRLLNESNEEAVQCLPETNTLCAQG